MSATTLNWKIASWFHFPAKMKECVQQLLGFATLNTDPWLSGCFRRAAMPRLTSKPALQIKVSVNAMTMINFREEPLAAKLTHPVMHKKKIIKSEIEGFVRQHFKKFGLTKKRSWIVPEALCTIKLTKRFSYNTAIHISPGCLAGYAEHLQTVGNRLRWTSSCRQQTHRSHNLKMKEVNRTVGLIGGNRLRIFAFVHTVPVEQ
jgi:hypothetical protein